MSSPQKKARDRGKRNQRNVIKLLKEYDKELRNVGIAGAEDLVGKTLVVEAKERENLPKWLLHAFDQLREQDHPEKIHVVQIHLLRRKHLNDIIMMTMKTFIRLLRTYIGGMSNGTGH